MICLSFCFLSVFSFFLSFFNKRLNSVSLSHQGKLHFKNPYRITRKNTESKHSALCCFVFYSKYSSVFSQLLFNGPSNRISVGVVIEFAIKLLDNQGADFLADQWPSMKESREVKKGSSSNKGKRHAPCPRSLMRPFSPLRCGPFLKDRSCGRVVNNCICMSTKCSTKRHRSKAGWPSTTLFFRTGNPLPCVSRLLENVRRTSTDLLSALCIPRGLSLQGGRTRWHLAHESLSDAAFLLTWWEVLFMTSQRVDLCYCKV